MAERVKLAIEAGVATVLLARADKMNAIDPAMFRALAQTGERLRADRSVRAVVLSAEGGNFCAGIDLGSLAGTLSDNAAFRKLKDDLPAGEIANEFQKAAYVWKEVEVPVIAAIRGVALGGGLQIALGADIRIAAPDSRLSVMEIRWGIIPDMAIMAALPRLVRMDVAKDLVLSGRVVGAEEALAIGLVTRLADDPLAAALEEARAIAGRSPDAVRAAKALLEKGWTLPPMEALALEAELQAGIIGFDNQAEAVRANMEKRLPLFRD